MLVTSKTNSFWLANLKLGNSTNGFTSRTIDAFLRKSAGSESVLFKNIIWPQFWSRLLFNSYLVIVLAVTPLILGLPRSIDMDLASFTKGLFLLFGIFYKDDLLCVDIVWVSAVVSSLGWVSSVLWLVCNSNKTHPPTQPPWPQPNLWSVLRLLVRARLL